MIRMNIREPTPENRRWKRTSSQGKVMAGVSRGISGGGCASMCVSLCVSEWCVLQGTWLLTAVY